MQTSEPNQKQRLLEIFKKQNPVSLNNKSVYLQDYESLWDHNWLRTQAISSLLTLMEKKFVQKVEEMLNNQNFGQKLMLILKGKFEKYVKIVDPFVVTMILFTQEDFILQTLEGLGLFDEFTKYVVFPMNTQYGKGNHWFLTILKNPRYQGLSQLIYQIQYNQQKQVHRQKQCKQTQEHLKLIKKNLSFKAELLILNSIPESKQDSSLYMSKQLSYQINRLLKLFYPKQSHDHKFEIKFVKQISHQSNSYDCGVYTVGFVQKLLFNQVLSEELEYIVKMRMWESNFTMEDRPFDSKDQMNTLQEWSKIIKNKQLKKETQFVLSKSSLYLRKHYRELLENQILQQNSI